MKKFKKTSIDQILENYAHEIYIRNCKNFISFTLGGTIITGAIVVLGFLMSSYTEFVIEYASFFAYMFLIHLLARYTFRHQIKQVRLIYYLCITPVLLGGIMMGTFLDPDQPAITIMILLNVMTLFIMDKPLRIIFYNFTIALIFIICCYIAKDNAWFMADLVDLLIYFCIGTGVNYFMLKGQVESAENYCLLQYRSERDTLTGILNRGTGEINVSTQINARIAGAFIILDIDRFKQVNDHYGHMIGDEAICEVARILTETFRSEDTIFRLGGDEFAVFAPYLVDKELCNQRFDALKEAAAHIHTSDPRCSSIGLSIGCTIYRSEKASFEQIYHSSDAVLYWAKKNGRGNAVITEL